MKQMTRGILTILALCSLAAASLAEEAAEAGATPGTAATAAPKAKKKKAAMPEWLKTDMSNSATNRESFITAEKIEYDNKEGVIMFDTNVVVDDPRFLLRSDQLLLFLDGTNSNQDVAQIMAIGHVCITNQNRSASCDKAVYTREDGQIVMTGNARLNSGGSAAGEVQGNRITFWLNDERMEVSEGSKVVLPPGLFNKQVREAQKAKK